MAEKKLICVIGATGNQGGSVARRFLQDSRFAVRALTRNPGSPAAQALKDLGAEVVQAELEDVESLKSAFQGANIIFSVTQYWEPFFRPDCRAKAAELGISCRKYAYDVEYRQGKNIADAAATVVDSLDDNGFLVSTLSHAGKATSGKMTEVYHFDSKADIFPQYVDEKYPELAKKMSCIHTGYFNTSHQILPNSYFQKQPDGSFQMRFPVRENRPIPHHDVVGDTGNFVYAVSQMPPGKAYMAAGSIVSFGEYIRLFGEHNNVPVSYKQVTFDDMVADTLGDEATGIEVANMYVYADDPGYDGGMELLTAEDLRKAGIDCPMTTLEEWIKKQDWSHVLAK
ncbi:NAD(P)-binding protein [Cercophora newfieldiana]|uniref:NAD(P)-binding protein n=1 Tax=Cercophora newfieldiana TaxID=92897 RepID=A0AA40CKL7_9PEZI|nr:NAD(P)-binding protein [Cercophora newfieldiana]